MPTSPRLPATAIVITLLIAGCATTTPHYESAVTAPNSVVHYANPVFVRKVSWFGWLTSLAMTSGGAYAGYYSNIALKWDDKGETISPIGNAVLGGLAGFALSGICYEILYGGSPANKPVTTATAADWLDDLDDSKLLVDTKTGSTPYGIGVTVLSAIGHKADAQFTIANLSDAALFARTFPNSPHTDSVLSTGLNTIPRADIPQVLNLFPSTPLALQYQQRYVTAATTLDDYTKAVAQYPGVTELTAAHALSLVQTPADIITYNTLFPGNANTDSLVHAAALKTPRTQLPALIDKFPASAHLPEMKSRYLQQSNSVNDIATALQKYPELKGQADSLMAAKAASVRDFKLYLNTFGDGAYAPAIQAKLKKALETAEALGPHINTDGPEYAPVISPDGNTLFFVKRNGDEDIWYAIKGTDGEWTQAHDIGAPLNTLGSNAVESVTPDGNTLLLHSTYSYEQGFSLAHKTVEGWSDPEPVSIPTFYSMSTYFNGYLTNDGKAIVVSVRRRDSYGDDNDLYVTFMRPDGKWTGLTNLGPVINTRAVEMAPFVAADGVTLYFASGGHGGEGGLDIFMSRRLDDTWKKWSKPVNLGPTINGASDDNFFFIPASGDYAYFSSDQASSGNDDIYRIGLPEFARPNPVVLVKGRVIDKKTGKPVGARIYYETLSDGREVGIARSNPADGHYEIALSAGSAYGFRAEAEGYMAVNDNLDLTKLTQYREQNKDLYLVPLEAGQVVRVNNLFFEFGRADLRRESYPELKRIITILKDNPTMAIEVQGHTDSVGTAEANMTLSQNRARAVADYLGAHGGARDRIATKGLGATQPIAANDTEDGRQQNRRVELVILHK